MDRGHRFQAPEAARFGGQMAEIADEMRFEKGKNHGSHDEKHSRCGRQQRSAPAADDPAAGRAYRPERQPGRCGDGSSERSVAGRHGQEGHGSEVRDRAPAQGASPPRRHLYPL